MNIIHRLREYLIGPPRPLRSARANTTSKVTARERATATNAKTNSTRQKSKYRNGRRIKGRNSSHQKGQLHPTTLLTRLPNGMPRQPRNYPNNLGHSLGSRIRNTKEKFLQEGRQLERRNPSQAALRYAPTREYDVSDIGNISKARIGWTQATNIAHNPLHGNWGALGHPMAQALQVPSTLSTHVPRNRLPESNLAEMWRPEARQAIRRMTSSEILKEEQFRQRRAESKQRRAKALYRSPRNISKSQRKVKSLSFKRLKRKTKSKRSF